jgi:hypothetical protein
VLSAQSLLPYLRGFKFTRGGRDPTRGENSADSIFVVLAATADHATCGGLCEENIINACKQVVCVCI